MTQPDRERLKREWNDFCELTFPSKYQAMEWWLSKLDSAHTETLQKVEEMRIKKGMEVTYDAGQVYAHNSVLDAVLYAIRNIK